MARSFKGELSPASLLILEEAARQAHAIDERRKDECKTLMRQFKQRVAAVRRILQAMSEKDMGLLGLDEATQFHAAVEAFQAATRRLG